MLQQSKQQKLVQSLQQAIQLTGNSLIPNQPSLYPAYLIQISPDANNNPHYASTLMRTLANTNDRYKLELRADHQVIRWLIHHLRDNPQAEQHLNTIVKASYPEAKVSPYAEPLPEFPRYRRYYLLGYVGESVFDPFLTADGIKQHNPLETLVRAMSSLARGSVAKLEIYINRVTQLSDDTIANEVFMPALEAGIDYHPRLSTNWIQLLFEIGRTILAYRALDKMVVQRFNDKQMEAYLTKMTQPLFMLRMAITLDTLDPTQLVLFDSLMAAMQDWHKGRGRYVPQLINTGDFEGTTLHHYTDYVLHNPMVQFLAYFKQSHQANDILLNTNIYMTATELAAHFHLPNENFFSERISWISHLPEGLIKNEKGIVLGEVETDTGIQKVRLSLIDFQYPFFITGAMGSGKTTVAEVIIEQLIELGLGFMVMDPQSPLANRSIQKAIAAGREKDIVYLNSDNEEYPLPLNLLRMSARSSVTTQIESVLWVLKNVFYKNWQDERMVRMIDSFTSLVEILLSDPEATFLDLYELGSNEIYRANMIALAGKRDLSIKTMLYLKRLNKMSPNRQDEYISSTVTRIMAFMRNPLMTNTLCHPYGLDFEQIIQQKKIVVVNLGGGVTDESKKTLGVVLTASLYLASRRLGTNHDLQGKEQEPRFYMLIDEAHQVLQGGLFKELNTQMRQFGVAQIYLSQSMKNFENDVVEIMRTNQGTLIANGTSNPSEATIDAKLLQPKVSAEDLLQLSVGEAAITTRDKGRVVQGFKMRTYDKSPVPSIDLLSAKKRATQRIEMVDGLGTKQIGLLDRGRIKRWHLSQMEQDFKINLIFDKGNNDEFPDLSVPLDIPERD